MHTASLTFQAPAYTCIVLESGSLHKMERDLAYHMLPLHVEAVFGLLLAKAVACQQLQIVLDGLVPLITQGDEQAWLCRSCAELAVVMMTYLCPYISVVVASEARRGGREVRQGHVMNEDHVNITLDVDDGPPGTWCSTHTINAGNTAGACSSTSGRAARAHSSVTGQVARK